MLEYFNETSMMLLFYHSLTFSDFVLDPETKYAVGFTFITIFGMIIAVNLFLSFRVSYTSAVIMKKKEKEKKRYDMMMQLYKNQQEAEYYNDWQRQLEIEEEFKAAESSSSSVESAESNKSSSDSSSSSSSSGSSSSSRSSDSSSSSSSSSSDRSSKMRVNMQVKIHCKIIKIAKIDKAGRIGNRIDNGLDTIRE